MSNINRAVTRTRRASPFHAGMSPAMNRALFLAALRDQKHPPFTVTRRARPSRPPQGQPMDSRIRLDNYATQNGSGGIPLTPGQNRRWLKKRHQQMKRQAPR